MRAPPQGLGSTTDTAADAAAALLVFDRETRGEHGRANASRDPDTGPLTAEEPKADNVLPREAAALAYGNSAQAGLRRLDKAAQAAGREQARQSRNRRAHPA
jgi:hypothetical protein